MAFFFNGTSTCYVFSSNDYDQLPPSNFSGACWIRPTTSGEGGYGRIWDKGNTWLFLISDAGADTDGLHLTVRRNTTDAESTSVDSVISYNVYQHVGFSFTWDSAPKLYINGAEPLYKSEIAGGGSYPNDSSTNLFFGNHATNGARTFDGRIAETALWSEALPAYAFEAMAKGVKPTRFAPHSLVAYTPAVYPSRDPLVGATYSSSSGAGDSALDPERVITPAPHWTTAAFVPRYATLAMPTGTITDGDMTARDCTITLHNAKWVA